MEERRHDDEEDDRRAKARLADARNSRRRQRHEKPEQQEGQTGADDSAREAETCAFDQPQANQAPAARPQRGTDGELALAHGAPCQKQVRHIRRGQQQQRKRRTEEDPQRAANRSHLIVADRKQAQPHVLAEHRRSLLPPTFERRNELRARLVDAHAGLQPGIGANKARHGHAALGRGQRLRENHVHSRQRGPFEIARQDADDPGCLSIEGKILAEGRGSATEAALPESIRNQTHVWRAGPIFHGVEVAPENRGDAEGRQEGGFRLRTRQPNRPRLGEIASVDAGPPGCHRFEWRPLAAKLPVGRAEEGGTRVDGRDDEAEEHDPIGVRIRQRTEQGAIEHAENGRVRADPERQRENRNNGERR
jgi:hypothetical protein